MGLIPFWRESGNRTPRLEDAVVERAASVINDFYLTPVKPTKLAAYKTLRDKLAEAGYMAPSYKWFCGLIKSIPDYESKLAREGRKGAYRFEPRVTIVDREAAPIAERAMALAHVDHTKIDLVVVTDGEPIRLWLTVMICAATRRVLAYALSFEPPSYRQVLLVVRDCVRRHSRLPRTIMVDGGKEFRSVWFEVFCAAYSVRIQRRPKSKARFGAQIERFFGTTTTQLLYAMTGNTQNTRNVRQMTAEVDPYKLAIWTVEELKKVVEKFFFETYDTSSHTSLLKSPRDAFNASVAEHGSIPHLFQTVDETFLILTGATTRSGVAKVQADGVKIHYLYYNHPSLRFRIGETLPVRFDPYNLANAWVHVGDDWLKVTSRHASALVNYSEYDVAVVTEAWRKRRTEVESKKLSEQGVVQLLKEIFTREEWLQQRRQSGAERHLRGGNAGSGVEYLDAPPMQVEPEVSPPPAETQPQPQQEPQSKPQRQRLQISAELYEMEMAK